MPFRWIVTARGSLRDLKHFFEAQINLCIGRPEKSSRADAH
jgi:hypothetical protein